MTYEEKNNNPDNPNEKKTDEEEIDEVFKDLKKEITDKRELSKFNLKEDGYYCKLCGNYASFKKEPITKWRTCSHCHIPIDRNCRSCVRSVILQSLFIFPRLFKFYFYRVILNYAFFRFVFLCTMVY